jgi:hypothetical protein
LLDLYPRYTTIPANASIGTTNSVMAVDRDMLYKPIDFTTITNRNPADITDIMITRIMVSLLLVMRII